MFNPYLIIVVSAIFLTACGGSSDSTPAPMNTIVPIPEPAPEPEPTPSTFTGVFLDSAVENLNYSTLSGSGTTNAAGEFSYQTNEKITFSIGGITFPEIDAETLVTPLTLFGTDDVNDTAVVNMLRLLQTLDEDGDADNGIKIPDTIHQLASVFAIDFNDSDFVMKVDQLLAMTGGFNRQLITVDDAIYHFQQTLANQNNSGCGSTHSKVGYSGFFSTLAHNVAGKATIIDDCTIEITQFDYDGGGPEVYVYAGIDHNYASATAFAVSNRISGESFANGELTLKLPTDKTLDDLTGLSVWCVDFDADFGNLEFTP